jgi:putative endopeptidase
MFRMTGFFALAALLGVTASALAGPTQPSEADGLMVDALDPAVPACENFYRHACNGWLKANPIPSDQSVWGVTDLLIDQTRAKLRGILENAAAEPDAETRKIGDFWAACMDEAAIEAKGLSPLQPELDRIDALSDKHALAPLVAHLHRLGVDVLFAFSSDQDYRDSSQVIAEADQGGLGLPERKYYLGTDARAQETRASYVAHLTRLFQLAETPDAPKAAAAVMALETELATASLPDVTRRDPTAVYHKLPRRALDKVTPDFQWASYLNEVGAPPVTALNVAVPSFFAGLQQIIARTPLDTLKLYLRSHLLEHAADMLPARFVEENFAFYGKTLGGAKELKPRWKRCVAFTDGALGEALGKVYVRSAFGPDAKARIGELVKNLRTAFAQDISAVPWMGEKTKQAALAKLAVMAEKIGYPDKWRDYSTLDVKRDDALGNRWRAAGFETDRLLGKIGKPVNKGEWYMTPPTVNAYYDDQKNDINFPAGILQPPNFDAHWDDAVNYGAIGATIGHEMTHGFDDAGRMFDAHANLRNWWSASDAKQFKVRASCLVAQYGGYTVIDNVKLDGNLTLGENAADNGGTRLAYLALLRALEGKTPPEIDGFTPQQRFFLAYAQSWCENQSPEGARLQALSDPHSTAEYRVNGVVSNMAEFRQAFRCPVGAPMAPEKTCRVW